MNIREEARKKGGDALVAKVDKGMALEKEVTQTIRELQQKFITDHGESEDVEEQFIALLALCEAMSTGYAVIVATMNRHPNNHSDRSEILVSAIRSFSNKLTGLFEKDDLEKNGISDLINAVIKAKGPLPKPKKGK